ncbi:frataxin-like protein [compost metagenome]
MMEEKRYRQLVAETYKKLEVAFDDVDPDVVELTRAGDVVTLLFPDGMRCILSPQPPLRQLWVAARTNAVHFNWNDEANAWHDDQGKGLELWSYLKDLVKAEVGEDVAL